MSGVQLSLRSEKGAAILNVIMITVLLGLAVLLISSVMNAAYERQRLRTQRNEMIAFVEGLRAQLQDADVCPRLLLNQVVGPAAGDERPVSINMGYGPSAGPIQAGWVLQPYIGGAGLSRVFARTIAPAISTVRLDKPSPTLTKHWVRIYVVPAVEIPWNTRDVADPSSTIIGATRPTHPEYAIDLHVKVDPTTNAIHQCHGPMSIANACEMRGGGYDAFQIDGRRCMPDRQCFLSPAGLTNVTGACPNPFTREDRMGGAPGPDIFMCSWCWDGVQNPP